MREAIAWTVCLLALCLVTALSYLFAVRHNPVAPESAVEPMPAVESKTGAGTPPAAARGEAVFAEQKCQTCHSIGGVGNPRSPLDGVSSRLSPEELPDWITGTGAATNSLSGTLIKRKRRYLEIPPDDLTALVSYLSSVPAR